MSAPLIGTPGSNYSESLSGIETPKAIPYFFGSCGSNYSESLSGIETAIKRVASDERFEVLITLNPYQGLKLTKNGPATF